LGLNVRLKGYVYRLHLYTVGLGKWFYYNTAAGSFNTKNFAADFIRLNLDFIHKNDIFGF